MGKGRIGGIGGIFFKTPDPEKTKQWYHEHMDMITDQWGAPFAFRKHSKPDEVAFLQWSPMIASTDYLSPSNVDFMVNYRVEHIEDLVAQLKAKGVTICDDITTYDYGKFVHVLDGDGRKIELWEPVDKVFEEMYTTPVNVE